MIQKLILLLKQYGLRAPGIIGQILFAKSVSFPLGGRMVRIRKDDAALYHLCYSMDKMRNLVSVLPDDKVKTIVDIGANNGLFSVLCAQKFPHARIYAYEPNPDIMDYLRSNVDGLPVTIVEAAVAGPGVKTSTLFFTDVSDQVGSLKKEAVDEFAGGDENIKSVEVKAYSFEDIINEYGEISVLKIDVQDTEDEILAPYINLLEKVDTMLLEVETKDEKGVRLFQTILDKFNSFELVNTVKNGYDVMFSKRRVN